MTTKQAKYIETVSVTTYQKRKKPRKHYVGSVCISLCSFFYCTGLVACTLISTKLHHWIYTDQLKETKGINQHGDRSPI